MRTITSLESDTALDSKARIREFIDRVLNAGDIDATGDYFHEGVVEEVPFPGQGPGIEGLKSVLRQFRAARILMDTLGMMQQLGVIPAGPGSHTVGA